MRRPILAVATLPALGPSVRAGDLLDREAASRILGRALLDEGAWTRLEHLTRRIGRRLSDGGPGLSLDTVGEHCFDWHHSHADTIDKVAPCELRRAVGLLAVMGCRPADLEERLVQ